ncbi:MAG TPA: cyclic nucleotide-binding domain-containing protein [Polyangiaceae bacterium]
MARRAGGALKELDQDELGMVRRVPFLAALDDETLREMAARSRRARWTKGARIVSELESGADVFIVLRGEAEVCLHSRRGEKEVLGRMGPGSAFGEMSSLTGELRSATVLALDAVEALVVPDDVFDALRERRPQVAVALVRMMAARLAGAERAIDALLAAPSARAAQTAAAKADVKASRGSIGRAWRELVVGHRKDLAFLTFVGFVGALGFVRLAVYLSFRTSFAPFDILRAAYTTGFALLGVSAAASLLTFRPGWRRGIALAYGIAVALILNELGVTLAFDIFYKDIHTPDPTVPFDVEQLYRRTEGVRAVLIALGVLLQAAYLRPFWRRAAFVLRTRIRKVLARSTAARSR